MNEGLQALYNLSVTNLRTLASALRSGPLAFGLSKSAIQQIVGDKSSELTLCLEQLQRSGLSAKHVAVLVDAIADTRVCAPDPAVMFEMVLSGPDVPGIPTEDTAAVVQTLFREAKSEILLVGYAVYKGERLFEPLAAKFRENPDLKVTFCLDIARRFGDTSLDSEIVRRFAAEFRKHHWPWLELPAVYYDPRGLTPVADQRASLHAKCVVVDRCSALITSANFTEAAQYRNIELGLLIRHRPIAERISEYFKGLIASGILVRCNIDLGTGSS